jgi:hypothetical protein
VRRCSRPVVVGSWPRSRQQSWRQAAHLAVSRSLLGPGRRCPKLHRDTVPVQRSDGYRRFHRCTIHRAGALWLIRIGVKIWRSPGGDASRQLMVVGWDRAVLMMGIALACMAVAVVGQALLDITKSPVTRWAFGVGSVAMVVSACLFASIWFFNRPRFLVPPALRGLPGTLRAQDCTRSGHNSELEM